MDLSAECRAARHDEDVAQLRRVPALREMVATGMSQREIATALGISQPAVSQHVNAASDLPSVHPEKRIEVAPGSSATTAGGR